MKILSVNNTADIYGASRCMQRVLRRFLQDGHEVHVILPEEGALSNLLRSDGAIVHIHRGLPIIDRMQMKSLRGLVRFLAHFPVSVVRIASLLVTEGIDVVHSNVVVISSPAVAAFLTRRRHVWHVRELLSEFGGLWSPYQRFVSMLSDHVVAISQCTRDQFAPSLLDKVEVIYDGLDQSAEVVLSDRRMRVREGVPEDALLIGVVGRIKFHRKGQEVLVRAAKLLRDEFPTVRYVVVGSASPGNEDQLTRLEQLISSLEMTDRISLIGESDHPASIFAALDIAVVPSVQPEPFGCVVIEAMAVGTPVVGSRCGGIAEQIVHGESGLLFTPGDATELAFALRQLLRDPVLRRTLAQTGRERVRTAFTLEETYQGMRSIFLNETGQANKVSEAEAS